MITHLEGIRNLLTGWWTYAMVTIPKPQFQNNSKTSLNKTDVYFWLKLYIHQGQEDWAHYSPPRSSSQTLFNNCYRLCGQLHTSSWSFLFLILHWPKQVIWPCLISKGTGENKTTICPGGYMKKNHVRLEANDWC